MATTYTVDLLNAEQTEVKDSGVLSYTGAATVIPATLNQVSPKGTVTSGALSTQQLVSGTGAQISTTRDVETHTLVTGDATNNVATATVALSPDNVTYSTLYVISIAAALNNLGALGVDAPVRVPAGWYLKITGSAHLAALPVTTYYQTMDMALLERSILGENASLSPLNKHSNAYAASLVVKTGTGILYGLTIYNSNASAQFIQIFDARDVPGTGAVPATVLTVAGSSNLPVAWLPGRTFQAGIVVCNSSTGPTLTLGSADCWFDAQYVQRLMPFVNGGTGGSGGSSSSVKLASATLTSPQILDLANTPVTVLPAPGAGKANIVTFVTGAYHYGTTPYTGSGTIGVAPNIRNNAYNLTESSLLTVAFSAIATFDASLFYTGGAIEYDHTDLVNQPWKAKVDQENTPLADGDGTLTIYCTYFTVDA